MVINSQTHLNMRFQITNRFQTDAVNAARAILDVCNQSTKQLCSHTSSIEKSNEHYLLVVQVKVNTDILDRIAPYSSTSNFDAHIVLCKMFHALAGIEIPDSMSSFYKLSSALFKGSFIVKKIDEFIDKQCIGSDPVVISQPASMGIALMPHQLRSLSFMMESEKRLERGGFRRLLWGEVGQWKGKSVWYSPMLSTMACDVPPQPTGGFLADDMGMGKTVVVLALIKLLPAVIIPGAKRETRATLVVCIGAVVGQWYTAARSSSLSVLKFDPKNDIVDDFDFDVVVVSTNHMSHARIKGVKWHRVVFDDSHMYKANNKLSCDAADIDADRRWVCSGTPLDGDLDALRGQFFALRLPKFLYNFSNDRRTTYYLLQQLLVRHTQRIVPRLAADTTILIDLPEHHSQVLDEYTRKTKSVWAACKGMGYVNNTNGSRILKALRMICSYGHPFISSKKGDNINLEAARASVAAQRNILSTADHYMQRNAKPIGLVDNVFVSPAWTASQSAILSAALTAAEDLNSLTLVTDNLNPTPLAPLDYKLRHIVAELTTGEDNVDKAVVFTHFTPVLRMMQQYLTTNGLRCVAIARNHNDDDANANALHAFQTDPAIRVVLLTYDDSSREAGISMTVANRIFLIEPAIDSAIDKWVINRVTQLGQTRGVILHRLVIKNTIEERLAQLMQAAYANGDNKISPLQDIYKKMDTECGYDPSTIKSLGNLFKKPSRFSLGFT